MGQLGGDMTPGSRPNIPPPNPTPAPPPDLGNSNPAANAPNPSAVGSTGTPSSPGPSKAHKLLTILQAGLQGAIAGRAADERAVAASGGHRSGGFGGGFEAGFTLPWQRQQQQLGLQQQQAQVDLTRTQSQMVPTQYGMLPAGLAKAILPAQIRGEATTDAAQIGAQGRVGAAQVTAGKPVVVPGRGLFQKDQQGQYQPVQGAEVPSVLVTPEEAQSLGHPELANQELDMGRYSQLLRGTAGATSTVQGAQGPATVNKITGKTKSLGLGSPAVAAAQARPVQVADPNNPGNVTYTTAGNAIKTGAPSPQGAPTAAAKTEARSEVPTKIGDQKVAFNTMIQHADLLKSAIMALHNGDEQTISSLKNRLKAEFGVAGPVTAEAIANAYQHEVVSVIAKGHMTDAEVSKSGKVLNINAQSPEQSLGVLDAYRALAQSKMNMLTNQANAAKGGNQATGGMSAADMLKKYPPKK